jgi:hypothetical protein
MYISLIYVDYHHHNYELLLFLFIEMFIILIQLMQKNQQTKMSPVRQASVLIVICENVNEHGSN